MPKKPARKTFFDIALDQGWDTYALEDILLDFLKQEKLMEKFTEYCEKVAKAENEDGGA